MKSFLYHSNLKEDNLYEYREMVLEELLVEAAGAAADTKGKLRELEVGQHLNGGEHMLSYRAEGKTPGEMHHIHSIKAHGENFRDTDSFKKSQKSAKKAAGDIRNHLKKFGYGDVKRTVWTSQPSDHKSETGVDDPNNSADLILTSSKSHKRPAPGGKTRSENKMAVSVKTGSGSVNYSNPGIASLSKLAGRDLSQHIKEHEKVLKANLPEGKGNSHDKYKSLRDSTDVGMQSRAAEIKHSSERMNNDVAHNLRQGLASKSHEELHKAIAHEVSPETHLKHIVSRQITDAKTGEEKKHETYDLHKHVQEYLNHFHGLHVDPNGAGGSVTVHGYHKDTGKKMAVARFTVHAGGRPANNSPRGSTVLPSEDNKDIKYTADSEHMEH